MDDWGWFIAFMLAMNSLTIAGVMVWLSLTWQIPIFVFWIVPPAAIMILSAYAYALHRSYKEGKFKKLVALSLLLPAVTLGSYTYFGATTPNWVFTLATDKSSYVVGENVQITVTLKNRAFLSQSVASSVNSSFVVRILPVDYSSMTAWCAPYQYSETILSARSGESIVRTYVWNTTDIANLYLRDIYVGRELVSYWIWVSMPQKGPCEVANPEFDTPFIASVNINVTAAQ